MLDADGRPARGDYGTSVLKLRPDPASSAADQHGNPNGWGLKVAGYFTPFNQDKMGDPNHDLDLGSGGVVLLDEAVTIEPVNVGGAVTNVPRRLLAIAGKEGVIYVIDCDAMERFRFDAARDAVFQWLPADPAGTPPVGEVFGMPASAWSRLFIVGAPAHLPGSGGAVGPMRIKPNTPEPMRSFPIVRARLATVGDTATTVVFGWKTGTPTLSGPDPARGIVWITRSEGYLPAAPAVLHAFRATNLQEIYNSNMRGRADQPGVGIKFTVPTVAAGRVYLGGKKQVTVYGLLGR